MAFDDGLGWNYDSWDKGEGQIWEQFREHNGEDLDEGLVMEGEKEEGVY